MNKLSLRVAGRHITAFVLLLVTWPSDAAVTSLAHALAIFMKNGATAAPPTVSKELALLEKTPAVLKAAKILSEGLSESESLQMATLLDRVYWDELSKRKITQSIAMTCGNCLPTQFAEDINGRAIDIIRRKSDLMVSISAKPNSITGILDANGKRMPTTADRKAIIDQLMIEFSPAMTQAMKEKTSSAFIQTFSKKLRENGSLEIEYDAKGHGLTAVVKYGPTKAKVANIDLSKFISHAKSYIYGGALAGLGFAKFKSDQTAEEKKKQAEIEERRSEILKLLHQRDRDALMRSVDAEYFAAKVKELQASKK